MFEWNHRIFRKRFSSTWENSICPRMKYFVSLQLWWVRWGIFWRHKKELLSCNPICDAFLHAPLLACQGAHSQKDDVDGKFDTFSFFSGSWWEQEHINYWIIPARILTTLEEGKYMTSSLPACVGGWLIHLIMQLAARCWQGSGLWHKCSAEHLMDLWCKCQSWVPQNDFWIQSNAERNFPVGIRIP